MASPPNTAIYTSIRNARSYSEQVDALRLLKNDITGHLHRKEKWVECGILEPIVKALQASRPSSSHNGNDFRGPAAQSRKLSEAELVRLQALQLLSVFANGGPRFIQPLQAAGAMPAILTNIFPLDNPPQIVVTALRAFGNIADAAALARSSPLSTTGLAELVFSPLHLDALHSILGSDSATAVVQEQKRRVAGLIGRLCRGDKHQNALANCGILDALATMLASFVVARGEVVPGAEELGRKDGMADMIPDPAPPGADLAVILEAISAIISESRFRTCMLLCSPAIMAVLPNAEFSPLTGSRKMWHLIDPSGLASQRRNNPGAIDYLLPIVPVHRWKSPLTLLGQFPPLGSSVAAEDPVLNRRASASGPTGGDDPNPFGVAPSNGDADLDEAESPLVPWLIHLVRSARDLERVMAASVLASLFKAGFARPEREGVIGSLVVPVLCRLIKETDLELSSVSSGNANDNLDPSLALNWAILERTPTVLARLIAGSELLQGCAHECGAVKMVCKLLTGSYDPMPERPARPWNPSPETDTSGGEGYLASRMGTPGYLPIYVHRIKMREAALKLMAAMISFKEEIRTAFVEQDILPYVVESLSPYPAKPKHGKERAKPEEGARGSGSATTDSPYGVNPNSVLTAACHIIRLLSRSMSILRTALDDSGVVVPIFKLLRHSDKDVQVAACGATCNLVLQISGMRKAFVDLGIVSVLCDHAHSLDAELRHNAVWALKHLVLEATNDLKKQCLEELEPGWLVQLICDDTEDDALSARLRRRRRGRHSNGDGNGEVDVDVEDSDGDDHMDIEGYEETSRPWLWPALYRTKSTGSTSKRSQSARVQRAERKLEALREAELNPVRKARKDDLAIQEQALNFIRNLIGPPEMDNALAEMVDHVFIELGQDRLFEILASKLRIRVVHAFGRRQGRGLEHPPRIIEAVVCILVHIAASTPRHRQLIIAQTELLKLLGYHLNSKDFDVRRALCHLLANLAWKDDEEDDQACLHRIAELKRLGFVDKLEGLEKHDGELDVRERARNAVWQIKGVYQ